MASSEATAGALVKVTQSTWPATICSTSLRAGRTSSAGSQR